MSATQSPQAPNGVPPDASARDEVGSKPAARSWLRFAPLVVIVGALGVALATGAGQLGSLDALTQNYAQLKAMVAANPVLWGAAFVVFYAIAVTISLPGALWFTIAAGVLFDWQLGALYAWLGATSGAVFVFLAARTAVGESLRRRAGPGLAKLMAELDRDAFFYMVLTRLIPLPFFGVNLAWALVNARLAPYALATAIGIIPGTLAYATLGAGAGDVIANGGQIDVSLLAEPKLIAGLVGLGLVSLIGLVLNRRRRAVAAAKAAHS